MYLREDFQDAISLMSRKLVKVRPLITHISDLDHVEDAFRTATLKERAVKVLVRI
jgi:threonine dehydrogenase-like Zn-dependent dehydrogenase